MMQFLCRSLVKTRSGQLSNPTSPCLLKVPMNGVQKKSCCSSRWACRYWAPISSCKMSRLFWTPNVFDIIIAGRGAASACVPSFAGAPVVVTVAIVSIMSGPCLRLRRERRFWVCRRSLRFGGAWSLIMRFMLSTILWSSRCLLLENPDGLVRLAVSSSINLVCGKTQSLGMLTGCPCTVKKEPNTWYRFNQD